MKHKLILILLAVFLRSILSSIVSYSQRAEFQSAVMLSCNKLSIFNGHCVTF